MKNNNPLIPFRRQITILFADIVSSSQIVTDFDPEVADTIFRKVIDVCGQAIQETNGTLNQMLGDGVMALFGVENEYENHALKAFLSAQAMLSAIRDLNKDFKEKYNTTIKLRIGLNTGEAVVQKTDESHRAKYRATGEAVHLTDRIQKLAPHNNVALSEQTKALLSKFCKFQHLGNISLTEKSKSKKVYTAKLRTSYQDSPKVIKAKYVVRPKVETIIYKNLNQVLKQKVCMTNLVIGKPGIGKTRLIEEFITNIDSQNQKVIKWDFFPYALTNKKGDLNYILVRKCLNALNPSFKKKLTLKKLIPFLKNLKLENAYAKDVIQDVLGYKSYGPEYKNLIPQAKREVRNVVLRDFIYKTSLHKPIILIFEDVHWAQRQHINLIKVLSEKTTASSSVYILISSRVLVPEIPELMASTIKLKPFTKEKCLKILERIVGYEQSLEKLKTKILNVSDGNPFFIEETAKLLFEQNILQKSGSTTIQTVEISEITIPLTVNDVMLCRLDELEREEKELIRYASSIGSRFNLNILRKLLSKSRKEVVAILNRLEKKGFVRRYKLFPDAEYMFHHALLHKTVYETLLVGERKKLHQQIISILRGPDFKNLKNRYELLATHAHVAGLKKWEFIYARKAANSLQDISEYEQSVDYNNQALNALKNVSGHINKDKHIIRTRLGLIRAFCIIGEYESVKREIQKTKRFKSLKQEEQLRVEVLSYELVYFWAQNKLIKAQKIGRDILKLNNKNKNRDILIRENARLAHISFELADFENSLKHDNIVLGNILFHEKYKKFELLVGAKIGSHVCQAMSYAELGQTKAANRSIEYTLKLLKHCKDEFTIIYSHVFLADAFFLLNKHEKTISLLEKADRLCHKMNAALLHALVKSALGYALVKSGKRKDIKFTKSSLEMLKTHKAVVYNTLTQLWAACAFMEIGDYKRATRLLEEALETATQKKEIRRSAWIIYKLAICYFYISPDANQIKIMVHKASSIAKKHKMKALETKIYIFQNQLSESEQNISALL